MRHYMDQIFHSETKFYVAAIFCLLGGLKLSMMSRNYWRGFCQNHQEREYGTAWLFLACFYFSTIYSLVFFMCFAVISWGTLFKIVK